MTDKLYEFKFFDGQVFCGRGQDERDALKRLGLGAYNKAAYTALEARYVRKGPRWRYPHTRWNTTDPTARAAINARPSLN